MQVSKKWNPEFEIGILKLDSQHKILFQLISNLDNITKVGVEKQRIIKTLLDVLTTYIFNHFETEEEHFKHHANYLLHCHEHYKLVKKLNEFISEFHNNRIDDKDLAQFLESWLVDHILETDIPFLKPLKVDKQSPASEIFDEYGLERSEQRHFQRIQQNEIVDEEITAHCFNATTMKNSRASIINMSPGGLLLQCKSQMNIDDLLIISCRVGKSFKMKETVRIKTAKDLLYGVEFIDPKSETIDFFTELYGAVHIKPK